ncbi:MAG TPA: M48 family metalloprotease [Candidatus Omnitrophota bacterium]|nr:M48 family metalloprotease [Candidatus Omnitrophota bacterium]
MDRRTFVKGASSALALGLGGCTVHQTGSATGLTDVPPGYRPDPKTDEAGFWMHADFAEEKTRTAANRIRDKAINDLVADSMCRLTRNYCGDVRTYVLRVPVFNAFASPNGVVSVWSGLLLRMEDESQLAAVLGHEFAHYRRRHTLAQARDIRNKTDLAAFLGMGLAAMGAGPGAQDLTQLLTMASINAFSREHEREADALGLQVMADAGYDPFACAQVWKNLNAERDASGEKREYDVFVATHPDPGERIENLTKLAEARSKAGNAPNRLREAIAPIRPMLLADEVNLGRFKQTLQLFDRLLKDDARPGEILFAKGELHRKRNKEADDVIALGFYHEACEAKGAPADAFRQVGIMRWRRGEKGPAREYFRRYLNAAPDASDRQMIQSYLAGA